MILYDFGIMFVFWFVDFGINNFEGVIFLNFCCGNELIYFLLKNNKLIGKIFVIYDVCMSLEVLIFFEN